MNITREQMLEFFDGILCRLDYEYTRDTPRFKEMTAAIESLIESSGDKAPLPAEVEAAMGKVGGILAGWSFHYGFPSEEGLAALAVIRAALTKP